jgi:microsomal dipeptidase-like Zn-dependent dipeptidase
MKIVGVAVGLSLAIFFWVGSDLERYVNRLEPFALPAASEEARAIHDSSFVVDLHADSLLFGRDLLAPGDVGHVDLPRLQEGGVGLQVFSAPTRTPFGFDIHNTHANAIDLMTVATFAQRSPMARMGALDRAFDQANRLSDAIARSKGALVAIRSRAELDALIVRKSEDRSAVGALFSLEGAHALEGSLRNFDGLFDVGVRMIGLTHFFDNQFAGSAHGVEKGGLTDLGRELVTLMEARGVVVDMAHLSPAAIDDVLAMAKRPTLISHGGVRGTCDNPRNISDEHVRAIAAGGGVIGIGYFDLAVCGNEPRDIVAAMRHVIELVGDDHVALGSDYDGGITATFDTSQLRGLTQQMIDEGIPPESIRKILGSNAVRVLRQTLPRR